MEHMVLNISETDQGFHSLTSQGINGNAGMYREGDYIAFHDMDSFHGKYEQSRIKYTKENWQ